MVLKPNVQFTKRRNIVLPPTAKGKWNASIFTDYAVKETLFRCQNMVLTPATQGHWNATETPFLNRFAVETWL